MTEKKVLKMKCCINTTSILSGSTLKYKTTNLFDKNYLVYSVSRDTYTSREQNDLHEHGHVHGTSPSGDRGKESGTRSVSARNRDLLQVP